MRTERNDQSTASSTLSAFLNHSLSGGGGDWISGDWKTKGELVFWIHPGNNLRDCAYFTHSFFRTKTFDGKDGEPETTDVRWFQFVCCDPDKTAGRARWYEDDGYRQNPPQVCPIDFMLEWVSVEIAAGRLDWKTPIFEFTGDNEKKDRLLRAGGMLDLFGSKDNSKAQKEELRRAGIDLQTSFQQVVGVKGGYLIAVVDDDPRDSIQKFAIQGTGAPKSLPALFKDAIAKVQKGYSVDNPETGRRTNVGPADPIMRPYRFTYVKPERGFGEYGVSPLNREPDKQVLELFAEPCPDMSEDRAKGNCPELLMIMKAHCVYNGLPIESFFEKADRAGLMKPRDEKPKKPRLGAAHEVVGGARLPNATAASSTKAPTVECLSCGKGMDVDDLACRTCGATYDEGGDLDGLSCLSCKAVVPVNDTCARHICPKCGAVHALEYAEDRKRAAGRRPVWQLADALPGDAETSDGEGGAGDDSIPW